ncbi:MAG: hypothetical protein CVV44_02725 [Spirochaetae bacterium HGW-Spirochaetae-1]|jgi:uncharacterized protein (DUF362 family)|nr:MAG: hypothetical protein CVV44_02725 [Spirochaetae bacterium HGW-Spirochaetae-1]
MKAFTDKDVFVIAGHGPLENARQAMMKIDTSIFRGKSVLIKPNIGRMVGPGKGINTHPDAVAGVIEALRLGGAGKIAIGESPIVGVDVTKAFSLSGISDVAEKYDCELIDMDARDFITKEIPHGLVLDNTKICSTIYKFDILLSLPVAKCHMHTGVTLGIKNMKGCLYRREKIRYHQLEWRPGSEHQEKTLDLAISDMATILLPDITVIDGYIGMDGLGPSGGDPVHSNFALASAHPLGADIIGATLMGKKPGDIPHLRLIAERLGLSPEAGGYHVIPENYQEYITEYRDPPKDISIEYPDVELVDIDSCSACLSTVMLFLKRFKKDMEQYIPDDKTLALAIGKGVTEKDIREGTVLIGNCARLHSDKYTFVKGCPPVATRIFEAITGHEPPENEPDVK